MEVGRGSVEALGLAMQRFGWPDYLVFVAMLLICVVIGIYFGFFAKQVSAQDYLMGGRNMKTFPVALSLISSFISGITLLGTPTEIYLYGIQYVYIGVGVLFMGLTMGYAYLPVFHDLQLTSTYEYLEKRFNKKVRLFGSFLFSISLIFWMPIVIYVPALAFNQVTGVNVHIVTPVVCLVCIFYTCVGGLKAVVYTDVIQTFIMFGAMILVIVKGTLDVGGFGVVWQRNYDSGRIEAPNFDPDPSVRHTVWSLTFGGGIFWLWSGAISQVMLQRYLSLPNKVNAMRALWIFIVGALGLIIICSYSGMLIYATYHACDPLTTKLAQAKDQLLPLLVMETLGQYPGLPGLFVAGVFSAALSSLSTGLNSMAAVVLEDFYKAFNKKQLTDRQADILMKTVVVVLGSICVALVFVVEKLGSVLQMSMSLGGITNGASLGIFTMGLFLPWVNSKGALAGGVASLGFMSWVCLGTQAAMASGDISFDLKPVSVDDCSYDFQHIFLEPAPVNKEEVFVLFRMSYLLYTLVGAVVAMAVALLVSFGTGANRAQDVDHILISPVVRRFLPARLPHPTGVDLALLNEYKTVELEISTHKPEKKELKLT